MSINAAVIYSNAGKAEMFDVINIFFHLLSTPSVSGYRNKNRPSSFL